MIDPKSDLKSPTSLQPRQYERLRAEAAAPYRSLRRFIYFGIGASGFIGAFVFFFQILAGRDLDRTLPNFAIQLAVICLMVLLWRWDKGPTKKPDQDI